MRKAAAVFPLVLLTFGVLSGQFPLSHAATTGKYFDYSITVLMENNDLQTVLSQGTFEASSANQYTLSTGYSGVAHPSEPNYVALLGGSTNGISIDGVCCFTVQASNLVDRLESAGLTWKAFAEDSASTGTCSFSPPRRGDHFPFLDYADVNTTSRCANFTTTASPGDSEFLNYLNSSKPANYVWLTPNDQDNGHNPPYIAAGDAYLSALLPGILSSNLFLTQRAALFIVYDEGNDVPCSSGGSDCVYASWSGPATKTGFSSSNSYTHYSYLHTVEDNWGLPTITSNDANAPIMAEFFAGNPRSPTGSCLFCLSSQSLPLLVIAVVLALVAVVTLVAGSRSGRNRKLAAKR